jgi:hypothetical protein
MNYITPACPVISIMNGSEALDQLQMLITALIFRHISDDSLKLKMRPSNI